MQRVKHYYLIKALLLCIVLQGSGAVHSASTKQYVLNVHAQHVEQALRSLASASGTQLLFPYDQLDASKLVSISGRYTLEEALTIILQDTSLSGQLTPEGVILITPTLKKSERGREMMNTKKSILASSIAFFMAQGSGAALGQDGAGAADVGLLDEIVVTATKREGSTLQNTAIAMSVLSNEDITRRGLVNMKDYLPTIPSVAYIEYGPTRNAVIIRGISLGNQDLQSAAGAYLGEMPMSSAATGAFDINLVDVERVEVLKGPQGTLYGSSALSGLTRSIPVAPDLQNTEGHIKVDMSAMSKSDDYGHSVEGALNIPLIDDQLALRVVTYRNENAGYVDVISTPVSRASAAAVGTTVIVEDDIGGSTSTGARASLLWSPSDQLDATLIVGTQELKTDGVSRELSALGSYNTHYIDAGNGMKAGNESSDVNYGNVTVNYAFDWAVLTSATSIVEGDSTSNISLFLGNESNVFVAPISNLDKITTDIFSQELRLASTLDGPLQFIAGLFYEDVHRDLLNENLSSFNDPELLYRANFILDYQQKAFFGEVSYQFNDVWALTLGGRHFDYDRTDATQTKPSFFSGDNPLPVPDLDAGETGDLFKANLSFTPNDNTLLYAQVSEGFRLGRGQALPLLNLCDVNNDRKLDGTEADLTTRVDADTTENFELGGKFTLLDNRLTLNAAIFRIDWSNLPVKILSATEACPSGAGIVNNLGEARSEGVELEGSFAVTADLLVNFSAAYMDAELTEVRSGFGELGESLPFAPQSSASLGVQYDFELADSPSFVRADVSYVGEYENGFKSNNYPASGDYTKVNLRAGMNLNESWSLGFYVNNLLGEDATTIDEFADLRVAPRKLGFEMNYSF